MLFLRGQYDAVAANIEGRARLAGHKVTTRARVYHRGRHGCWNEHPWFDVMVDEIDDFLARTLGDPTPGQLIRWTGAWLKKPSKPLPTSWECRWSKRPMGLSRSPTPP